jgi:hypothetical protein
MFQREVACQAVTGHNVHHGVSKVQEGGTGMVAFGDTAGYISKVGKDPYGLGRWGWMYNACKNNMKDLHTMYQQQCQYFITKKKDLTCPNKLFWLHLLQQLVKWRAAGDQIILFMDHNKHMYDGPLGRALANTSGLGL